MTTAQQDRPTERELALTAHARHKAFRRKLEEKAAELEAERDRKTSELQVAILQAKEARLQAKEARTSAIMAEPRREWPDIIDDVAPFPIRVIQRAVCKHYKISLMEMLSERRTINLIVPRHVAMYLCKELTLKSLPEIGRRFGMRDHTTVLHAARKVSGWVEKPHLEPAVVADIVMLRAKLEAAQ